MPPVSPLAILQQTLQTTKTLLHTFATALNSPTSPPPLALPPKDSATPLNPLALLSDIAKVLKAQVTKLSLLALNKPFTPSEITFILHALNRECLPALMSAAQLLPEEKYTRFLKRCVGRGVADLMREMGNLVNEIPIAEGEGKGERNGKGEGRHTLASTGVVWDICDVLVRIAEKGLRECAAVKVGEWHGLFKDAVDELEVWNGGGELVDMVKGTETMALRDRNGRDKFSARRESSASEDSDPFETQGPRTEALRTFTARVLRTLKLVQLLYSPLTKRRIRRFPEISMSTREDDLPTTEQAEKMDDLIQYCKLFTNEADEIAGMLYEADEMTGLLYEDEEEEIMKRLGTMKGSARKCLDRVKERWEGGEDEFSVWVGKWLLKLDET